MSTSESPAAKEGKSAIVFGATGAVGKPLVAELLESPYYSTVHAFVRRPFKETSPHKESSKLVEHIIDFEKLLQSDEATTNKVKQIDAETVYITLGTTRALAGSAEAFVKIDREYVLAAAKAALQTKDSQSNQRLLYVSTQAANSKTFFLYPQSKGLTEEGLAALGYSDLLLFRPGFLANAQRENKRVVEDIFGSLTNLGSKFSNSLQIDVKVLAKAMTLAGIKGTAGVTSLGVGSPPSDSFKRTKDSKVTVLSNAESLKLAKESL